MKRLLNRSVTVGLLLVGIVAVSAAMIRPIISERIEQELKSKGIENLSLQFAWPSLQSITSNGIAFDFLAGKTTLRVEIQSATLDYEILSHNRLFKRLELNGLHISVPLAGESLELKIPVATLLPSELLGWITPSPTLVYFDFPKAPFPIKSGIAKIKLTDTGALEVLSSSAQLLGATVALEKPARWSPATAISITLEIRKLDIAHVLELYGRPELVASGLFSGSFVASFNGNGFKNGHGTLKSGSPGGRIQYKGETVGPTAKTSITTVQLALQDFRYSEARVSISASATGAMVFELHFTGNNPALQNGRVIELKLNVQDNLIKLMQTLRYGR